MGARAGGRAAKSKANSRRSGSGEGVGLPYPVTRGGQTGRARMAAAWAAHSRLRPSRMAAWAGGGAPVFLERGHRGR
uniref:Uncharacterized protein n=1 Tax=Triticum urartu TaxID=4572 RepID=A0A8R7K5J3_TRIUA